MEQLTQNLKDGRMELLTVPVPALSAGQILVRNHYSLISAGTEGKTVKDARLGYIAKARARKTEVKKVLQAARTIGWVETYKMVMNKLDAPSALGYSCAGVVLAVADDVKGFHPGDHVACGGAHAVHAEIVAVPVNLAVQIEKNIPLEYACFTTVAAIAMQGIRQADLRLGEHCVVIGLGLVGQLTLQLLKASGVQATGIDVDQQQVELAQSTGFRNTFNRNTEQLEEIILHLTDGYGADAVIIAAATSSDDPINLAGKLCRRKGKVIIVGAVPTGFERKNYYQKELDLRMSSSYGPGRYDDDYEEKGIDYPQAYVRWTENRNMQAFAELLRDEKINIKSLLTHTFDFKDATKAYDLVLNRSEPFAGIVLRYSTESVPEKVIQLHSSITKSSTVQLGIIGAGTFGQNILLPALKDKADFTGVATSRPNNARFVADKYGFSFCTGDANEVLNHKETNTIFIATRHNTHAEYVLKALANGKNVFVEKPLCLNEPELIAIGQALPKSSARLMVGYNRRFAPLVTTLKKQLNQSLPSAIMYRVNAGIIPAGHWVHDPVSGGGRIIGEVCHFVDLCIYLAGSMVESVSASALNDAHGHHDTVVISLSFKNGSIATINYFSNGNKAVSKEYIEVYNGGVVTQLDDFTSLEISGSRQQKITSKADKGHKAEVMAFISAIKDGKPSPIPFDELYNSTLTTFRIIDSVAGKGILMQV